MRINKYLASSGLGSRRSVEKLITDGKVVVNGQKVVDLAYNVDENNDIITVDGKMVNFINQFFYIILHKPKGCVTTVKDDKGRKTVMDFIPSSLRNIVKPVGRLDYDSEGLLLFTNDGQLASTITHPKNEIEKEYTVKIEGKIEQKDIRLLLTKGTVIDGKKVKPTAVKVVVSNDIESKLNVIIKEGKNREIRRLFESINKNVILLKRTRIGNLKLGGLSRGKSKEISAETAYMAIR